MAFIHTQSSKEAVVLQEKELQDNLEKINLELIHMCLVKTYQFLSEHYINQNITFFNNGYQTLDIIVSGGKSTHGIGSLKKGLDLKLTCWNVPAHTIAQFFSYYENGEFQVSFKNTAKNRLNNVASLLGNKENSQRWLQRNISYQEKEKLELHVLPKSSSEQSKSKKKI